MEIPTVVKLQENILSSLREKLNINIIKPNSFLYVFSYVLAGALYGCYYFANRMINNLFLDTTTDKDMIIRWGTFLGIDIKKGSTAEGKIKAYGGGGQHPRQGHPDQLLGGHIPHHWQGN